MAILQSLASDLGTSQQTLRRAVQIGMVKATRPSPRKLEITAGERVYLRANWQLLSRLRTILRPEHNVLVAIVYGSVARGSASDRSDLDIAVLLDDRATHRRLDLQMRLGNKLEMEVQVVDLNDGWSSQLWKHILRDGRVIVNRGDIDWRQTRTGRKR